jgi:hypothetical protein
VKFFSLVEKELSRILILLHELLLLFKNLSFPNNLFFLRKESLSNNNNECDGSGQEVEGGGLIEVPVEVDDSGIDNKEEEEDNKDDLEDDEEDEEEDNEAFAV